MLTANLLNLFFYEQVLITGKSLTCTCSLRQWTGYILTLQSDYPTISDVKMLIIKTLVIVHSHSLNFFSYFYKLKKKYHGSTGFLKISPIVKPIFVMIEFLFQLPWDENGLFFFLLDSTDTETSQRGLPFGCCNFTQFVFYLFECVHD